MKFEDDIDALYATYQSLLPMAEADSARLWQKFRLDWNYNSNRIEGNSLTYGETEALLILGTEPKRIEKDIREMKAHDMGIEYLLSLAEDERPIGETDIRTLNQITLKENYWITSETADGNVSEKEIVPGTYKKMPNHVRLRGGGIHKFAEPNEVPIRMAETVKMLRSYLKKQDKPLASFLAELHQYFIQTHPFDDGNGRVVRMLLNYVCLKLGWPHIIIKDKNKKEYLASLEQWDKGNKADLEAIMKSELIWSLRKSIAAARGESVEDPDDLDKEIDMFVRESEQALIPSEKSLANIKKLYQQCILPFMEIMERRSLKLAKIFKEVEITEKEQSIRWCLEQESELRSLGKNNFSFNYNFKELRTVANKVDIYLSLTLSLKDSSYVFDSFIEPYFKISNALPRSKQYELHYQGKLNTSMHSKAFGEYVAVTEVQNFADTITKQLKSLVEFYQNEFGRQITVYPDDEA